MTSGWRGGGSEVFRFVRCYMRGGGGGGRYLDLPHLFNFS